MGGHVGVGLEDAIFMSWDTKELASNTKLVERLVRVATSLGREPATPAEARAKVGLREGACRTHHLDSGK